MTQDSNRTVKAVVLKKKDEIVIEQVPAPGKPGPGEVLIKMHTVGICGSDVHYYTHGRIGPYVVKAPMILGHEGSGTVLEVGEGVEHLAPGDRICMEPGIPNPRSRASREGMYNVDPDVRFWATPPVDGCLVEEIIHPADYCFKLPDSMSFGEGALIEPFAVGMQAATKARIKPGDIAAVMGCGTIGIMCALAALGGGASKVYIGDIAEEKLALVKDYPNIIPVNVLKEDISEVIRRDTDGWGPEVVFEATGAPAVYKDIWSLPAPGGCLVIVGIPVDPVSFDAAAAQSRELRIETVFRYANMYQKAVNLVGSGAVNLKPLITETLPVDDAIAVFNRVAEARPTDTKLQMSFEL